MLPGGGVGRVVLGDTLVVGMMGFVVVVGNCWKFETLGSRLRSKYEVVCVILVRKSKFLVVMVGTN